MNNTDILICDICDYHTIYIKDYKKHLTTNKHKKFITTDGNFFVCHCGKQYQTISGIRKHSKICAIPDNNNVENNEVNTVQTKQEQEQIIQDKSPEIKFSDNEIIKMISEFKNIITDSNSEFKTMIMDLVKTIATTNNNTNNNNTNNTNNNTNNNNTNNTNNTINTTFNLQFFLDEQCKDALNIDEFVDSIKMQISDLEITGRRGYVHGITEIINKNLSKLDIFKRPIHCSDLKREVLYVKNNNIWTKETKENSVLTRAVKRVAHKNIQQITEWRNAHPGCTMADSRKNDLYLKIVSNAMSGSSFEEQHSNYEKIISNVAKMVVIVK
jgi:hypothetical protein